MLTPSAVRWLNQNIINQDLKCESVAADGWQLALKTEYDPAEGSSAMWQKQKSILSIDVTILISVTNPTH